MLTDEQARILHSIKMAEDGLVYFYEMPTNIMEIFFALEKLGCIEIDTSIGWAYIVGNGYIELNKYINSHD